MEVVDAEEAASARECAADSVGRVRKDSIITSRHLFYDCRRLGHEFAPDIVTDLVLRILHVSDKDTITFIVRPTDRYDFLLPTSTEYCECDDALH